MLCDAAARRYTEAPKGHAVRVTPAVYQAYKESIAANAPETFALIGGSLDDPMLITDFHFMAPRRDERGRFVASGAFVYPDHEQVNYIIDNVLVRKSHYMLGLWHSHPGSMNVPSRPDFDFCGRIIANDDSKGLRWNHFLAPITTFDENGRDTVTAWILPKGGREFEPARFVVEEDAPAPRHVRDRVDVGSREEADISGHALTIVERAYHLARHLELAEGELEFMQAHRISRNLASAQAIADSASPFHHARTPRK